MGEKELHEQKKKRALLATSLWQDVLRRLRSLQLRKSVSFATLRREAQAVAYAPDKGLDGFADKLKYTIATSYLLAPTLSISMYEHHDDAKPAPSLHVIPFSSHEYSIAIPPCMYKVSGKVCGANAAIPTAVAVLVMCSFVTVHISFVCITLLAATLCACTFLLFVAIFSAWQRQTVSCMVSMLPSSHPPFLAVRVPHPVWVADERIYLQVCILQQVEELVRAAQAMDHSVNDALAAVQEVELVSRGYKLSSPLAPISRLEATSASSDDSASPFMQHARFPLRLSGLRKDMIDALEEATFHCDAARQRLAKHQGISDRHLTRGLAAVRQNPRKGEPAKLTSPTPRILSLPGLNTPTHTPRPKLASGNTSFESLDMLHMCASSSPSIQRIDTSCDSPTHGGNANVFQQRTLRHDRLSLMSLRAHFESMHESRQSLLYALLGLDWDRIHTDSTCETLASFWNADLLQGILCALTVHFGQTATQMTNRIQKHMDMQETRSPAASTPQPTPPVLNRHAGLGECFNEMGRLLRTIQCKLHVCGEEVHLHTPSLHGVQPVLSPACGNNLQTVFESMRDDLLALSSEWEAGVRIMHPHAPESPPAPKGSTSFKNSVCTSESDSEETSESEARETSVYHSGTHDTQALHQLLLESTSPAHLPSPLGAEEVFEGATRSASAERLSKSHITRAERIQLRNEKRKTMSATLDKFQPHDMLHELKGVLNRRSISMPLTSAHASPSSPSSPSS